MSNTNQVPTFEETSSGSDDDEVIVATTNDTVNEDKVANEEEPEDTKPKKSATKSVTIDEDKKYDIETGGKSRHDNEMVALRSAASATKPNRTKPFIVLVAICAALGGLIFGYDIAGAGATFVMDGFRLHFGWDCAEGDTACVPASQDEIDRDQGVINGLFGAGATVGAVATPWVFDRFGRKRSLFTSSWIFIFGAAIQGGAVNMSMMWAGRVFSGYGIGGLSMCVPVYISEIAPEHVRGALATLWQLAITSGILVASAGNIGLKEVEWGWRVSYAGNILFALILIGSLFFMPESPRWLAAKDRSEELTSVMKKIRYDDELDREMTKLVYEVEEEKERGTASWPEIFSKENKMRYRLFLGIGLQAMQQLAGINAIMFYAPRILETYFSADAAVYGTFVLNGVNFCSTFITVYLIDRVGRVKLLVSGGVIMLISLVANSVLAAQDQSQEIGYGVITFCCLFIIGFAYSWGPVVWVVCSELFSLRERGKATGLTTMTNWLMTTIVGAVFPVASSASLAGCFAFFAGVIFVGIWVVWFFEAETSNKTISEVDEAYAEHKPKLRRTDF
mmetsp:Transcript_5737/g.16156  ORF Transcript_5737/g.16156 Transcript_5737/m.16156 type:complete len:564 (-) Transcript_5737:130-1821(-)|eukprot:CAMPEP_0181032238 /NCGR_PEP_ID=MMETSP1070-20121207/6639_1 /TAXON_ID=265543 /ORGANISM="Minutocellus polymorphus, Strain NH13" /LENGTH=563 /DNA_ID=CAMNT_0023109629 /DNA_START=72 /DNA_END=1763 /DNA_ORIENTATION=-